MTIPLIETAMLNRHRAVAYLQAATDVQPKNSALEPKYFLYSHAIELTLKAFLMVNGRTEKDCQRISHDLAQALRISEGIGLVISDVDRAIVASLSAQHHRSFSFRYFTSQGWSAPSFENCDKCCRHLLRAAQVQIFIGNGIQLTAAHQSLDR
jgi:hypothetical protein